MALKYDLDNDEIVILEDTHVSHGGIWALYTDDLILTNKRIICVKNGAFGGGNSVYCYDLEQIKEYNGEPQVRQGRLSNATATLEIHFEASVESFRFQSNCQKNIDKWINEIKKVYAGEILEQSSDDSDEPSVEDSVADTFKEVGAGFKEVGLGFRDVGREIAGVFGFKTKPAKEAKPISVDRNDKPIKANKSDVSLERKANEISCPSCGSTIPAQSRFCPKCGAQMMEQETVKEEPKTQICPSCGKSLSLDLRFCTQCGTELLSINKESLEAQEEKKTDNSTSANAESVSTESVISIDKEVEEKAEDSLSNSDGIAADQVSVISVQTNDPKDEPEKEKIPIERQIELLEKLKALVDAGIITQEEFENKKKEII